MPRWQTQRYFHNKRLLPRQDSDTIPASQRQRSGLHEPRLHGPGTGLWPASGVHHAALPTADRDGRMRDPHAQGAMRAPTSLRNAAACQPCNRRLDSVLQPSTAPPGTEEETPGLGICLSCLTCAGVAGSLQSADPRCGGGLPRAPPPILQWPQPAARPIAVAPSLDVAMAMRAPFSRSREKVPQSPRMIVCDAGAKKRNHSLK